MTLSFTALKEAFQPNRDKSKSLLSKTLSTLFHILKITVQEFQKNNLSLRASALTYTILLSLVPMLAMSTAVVKGLGGGDQLRDVAYSYIDTLETAKTPATDKTEDKNAQLTGHLRSAVDQVFDYVDRTNFATLGSFGVAGILVSVLLVLGNIETAMNSIWRVKKSRSLMRKISDYLTLLFLVPLTINVAFAASAFLKNPSLQSKIDILIPFVFVQALIFKFIPIFFISITLYIIYLFFPNTKVKTVPAVIGAAVAGTLWFGVQNIYISLQVGVANYNAIYGSFATFPLFLVWIYLGWMFILSGAQLAFALQNYKIFSSQEMNASPVLRLSLSFDIIEEIQKGYQKEIHIGPEQLAEKFPCYQEGLLDDLAQTMIKEKILYKVENGALIPAVPSEKLSHDRVLGIILGKDFSETKGGQLSRKLLSEKVR